MNNEPIVISNEIVETFKRLSKTVEVKEFDAAFESVDERFRYIFRAPGYCESDFFKSELLNFMHKSNNKHWPLERVKGAIARVPARELKNVFTHLTDEGHSLQSRINNANHSLKGVGIAVFSAVLLVAYPQRYSVLNTKGTRAAFEKLGLPVRKSKDRGAEYVYVNNLLCDIARSTGLSLWTVDACLWQIADDDSFTLRPFFTPRGRIVGIADLPPKSSDAELDVMGTMENRRNAMHKALEKAAKQPFATAEQSGKIRTNVVKTKGVSMTPQELTCLALELYEDGNHNCALTGIELTPTGAYRPSIDRIDSNGDYDVENIQLVCSIANMAKGETDNETFLAFIDQIKLTVQL